MKDRDPEVIAFAAGSLGQLKAPQAVGVLISALDYPGISGIDVKSSAASALGAIKDPRATEPLIALLKDPDARVRESAVWSLGQINDPRAVNPLIGALKDSQPGVRQSAANALLRTRAFDDLAQITDPQSIEVLKEENSRLQRNHAQASAITDLITRYIAAAATLDPSATKPFLATTCQGDLVTEFQVNKSSGWSFSEEDTKILSKSANEDDGRGFVVTEIMFQGGNPPTFIQKTQTFNLTLENGAWKILSMSPLPRTIGLGVSPLNR